MLDLEVNDRNKKPQLQLDLNERLNFNRLDERNIQECLDLFEKVYAQQALQSYPELVDSFINDNRNSVESIKNELRAGTMSGTVALVRNNVVGFVLVSEPNYIRKIAVAPVFQNRGLGSELIKTVERNNSEIVVHAAEDAIDFYSKNGFVADGPMNRDKYPYLPMKKVL